MAVRGGRKLGQLDVPSAGAAMAVTAATLAAQRSRIWRWRLGLDSFAEEEERYGSERGGGAMGQSEGAVGAAAGEGREASDGNR